MNRFIFVVVVLPFLSLVSCQQPAEKEQTPEQATLDSTPHLAKGQKIASSVFGVLSSEVAKSMKANGVAATIAYCNEQAYPITDSLAKVYQAHIKRTSHKVRNPQNAPDSLEAIMLNKYLTLQEKGLEMAPKVIQQGENTHFFAPILLAQPCLKCHGIVGETLDANDLAVIQQHYPADQAIDFSAGELRGIWSIRF